METVAFECKIRRVRKETNGMFQRLILSTSLLSSGTQETSRMCGYNESIGDHISILPLLPPVEVDGSLWGPMC